MPTSPGSSGRLDPVAGWLQQHLRAGAHPPKRIVFAEGEQPRSRAPPTPFHNAGLGRPILIGTTEIVREQFRALGMVLRPEYEMHRHPQVGRYLDEFAEFLYARLQRRGYLQRDCQRLVNNDRNMFAALHGGHGYADGMVSGVTRNWTTVYKDVRQVHGRRSPTAT